MGEDHMGGGHCSRQREGTHRDQPQLCNAILLTPHCFKKPPESVDATLTEDIPQLSNYDWIYMQNL